MEKVEEPAAFRPRRTHLQRHRDGQVRRTRCRDARASLRIRDPRSPPPAESRRRVSLQTKVKLASS